MWGSGKRAEPAAGVDSLWIVRRRGACVTQCVRRQERARGAWARYNPCLRSRGGAPLRLGRRGGNGEGQAWGGQACGRELNMLLGSKVPCGENHKVVEVPRLRLAQTTACRNSAVLFWARARRRASVSGGGEPLSESGALEPRGDLPDRSQSKPKRLRRVLRRSRGPEGPAGVNAGLLLPGLRSRAPPRQSPRSDVGWRR